MGVMDTYRVTITFEAASLQSAQNAALFGLEHLMANPYVNRADTFETATLEMHTTSPWVKVPFSS